MELRKGSGLLVGLNYCQSQGRDENVASRGDLYGFISLLDLANLWLYLPMLYLHVELDPGEGLQPHVR
jgi:hypothetical protein